MRPRSDSSITSRSDRPTGPGESSADPGGSSPSAASSGSGSARRSSGAASRCWMSPFVSPARAAWDWSATPCWPGARGNPIRVESSTSRRHEGPPFSALHRRGKTKRKCVRCPASGRCPAPAAGEADRLPGRPRRRWAGGCRKARTDPRGESHRSGPASPASEAASPHSGDGGKDGRSGPCPRVPVEDDNKSGNLARWAAGPRAPMR